MKSHYSFWLVLLSVISIQSSCKKNEVENDGLIGKWLLTEIHDPFTIDVGGQWKTIPLAEARTVQFFVNQKYLEKYNEAAHSMTCEGKYRIIAESMLEIESNCQPNIVTGKISELTSTILIIDMQGYEGIVRYKYSAIR